MVDRERIAACFARLDEDRRQLALDTVEEYLFFAEKIAELKKLPLIRVKKGDPARQQLTPAAKLIKDYSQAIDAKRKTLLSILYREDGSKDEGSALLEALKAFE